MDKTKDENEQKLKKLKSLLPDFDLAIPGTIRKVYLKCGKAGCACHKDKSARHGPYQLWDRKVGNRLSSMVIDNKDLPLIKRWIENRKTLEQRILESMQLSQSLAVSMIEQNRNARKKTKPPKTKT